MVSVHGLHFTEHKVIANVSAQASNFLTATAGMF